MSTVLCLNCGDAELVPVVGSEQWLACSACGRGYAANDVERLATRAERRRSSAEARACFEAEQHRPHEPGGSDDQLAVTFLRPLPDDSLVTSTTEKKRNVVRVKGLVASSDEVVAAIDEVLSDVA